MHIPEFRKTYDFVGTSLEKTSKTPMSSDFNELKES
jgi:hypothetical protein